MLPTEAEILGLSRWARAAFAARCARRVLPLYAANWPTAPTATVDDLAAGLALAERCHATGRHTEHPTDCRFTRTTALNDVMRLARAASFAAVNARAAADREEIPHRAAEVAEHAALVLHNALLLAAYHTEYEHAGYAALVAVVAADPDIEPAVREDFDRVKAATVGHCHDTPCPANVIEGGA